MPETPHAGQCRPPQRVEPVWTSDDRADLAPFNPAWLLIGFTIAIISIGTLMLALPISANSGRVSVLDAFFTAASAATTTGLTVVDTAGFFSYTGHNVIMWLMILGGFGSLVASTMLLLLIAGRVTMEERPLLKEFTGVQSARGMIVLILGVLAYAFVVQAAGAYLLEREFAANTSPAQAWWFARFHAASAFNNAGFDFIGLQQNPPPASTQLTLGALSFLGALGFIVVVDLLKGIFTRRLAVDTKMVLAGSAALVLVGMIAILATESGNPHTLGPLSVPQKLVSSLFHSLSARTAGMATTDLRLFAPETLMVLILLMFIGGASGSTAGGIKVNTFVLLMGVTWSFIRGRTHASVFGATMDEEHVNRALAILVLSATLVFVITLALSITEGKSLLAIVFETVSAFSTTGFSLGITSSLTPLGKVLIAFTMFAGKVGPITLAYALSQRQRPSYHTYAEEAVNLG